MNIGIDMMGGDYAPAEAVKGIVLYLSEAATSAALTLIGQKDKIDELLLQHTINPERIHIVMHRRLLKCTSILPKH